MIALDGTEYFSSQTIHCGACSHRTHKNGVTTYFRQAMPPVLVAPDKAQVITLRPEFIRPQGGHQKEDCERAAAKRWLALVDGFYQAVRQALATRLSSLMTYAR